MKFTITLSGVSGLMDVGRRLLGADKAVTEAVAKHAEDIESKRISRIYARPIPTRAQVAAYNAEIRAGAGKRAARRVAKAVTTSSADAWNRSGDLKAGLRTEFQGHNRAVIGIQGRAAAYAVPRHQLGVTRIPQHPALGITRRNPFAAETMEAIEIQVPGIAEAALKDVLS